MSSREFLGRVVDSYIHWQRQAPRFVGHRVGLQQREPVALLTNFLALLALDCEVVLLSPHLPPAALEQLRRQYRLRAIVDDSINCARYRGPRPQLSISELDSRFVVLSSGSMGDAKGIVHCWQNLRDAASGFSRHFQLDQLHWGHSLPLFHVGGLMSFFRPFFARGSYTVVSDSEFAVQLAEMAAHGANVLSLVPTHLARLRECGQLDLLQSWQLVFVGGGPWSKSQYGAYQLPLVDCYGMTEMMAMVASEGRALSGRTIAIGGGHLPAHGGSGRGIVEVKGPGQLLHYLEPGEGGQEAAARVSPRLRDGFFCTQDIGEWDSEGRLRILGRRDDAFQCGGENVWPAQIERELLGIRGVLSAVVVPRPDPEYGHVPLGLCR